VFLFMPGRATDQPRTGKTAGRLPARASRCRRRRGHPCGLWYQPSAPRTKTGTTPSSAASMIVSSNSWLPSVSGKHG
jgi:hypothetical protein